jgi:hypothetical protein
MKKGGFIHRMGRPFFNFEFDLCAAAYFISIFWYVNEMVSMGLSPPLDF